MGAPLPLGGLPALEALAGAPPLGCPPAEALAWPPLWAPAGELLAGELLDGELLEALLGALLEALAGALLADELLLEDALLDDALLEELDDELLLAVFSSSEKSISSGGSPSLLDEGSGGIRDSCGR